jgi:hypothetical protein
MTHGPRRMIAAAPEKQKWKPAVHEWSPRDSLRVDFWEALTDGKPRQSIMSHTAEVDKKKILLMK